MPFIPGVVVLFSEQGVSAAVHQPSLVSRGPCRAHSRGRSAHRPHRRAPSGSPGTLANQHAVQHVRTGAGPAAVKGWDVTVRTEEGKEQPYQIRPPVQEKLGNLRQGEKVILLINDENHVIDIAAPEAIKG